MSDENTPTTPASEAIELPADGDAAFSTLMDALVADEAPEENPAGDPPVAAAAAGDGSPAPAAQGTPATPGGSGAPAAGDGGSAPLPLPGAGTVDAESYSDNWGAALTGLETRQTEELQRVALAEVREEYGKYFDAIEQHPRSLVGQEVPRADGEGMETLSDSADAREWQEQIKLQLVKEVRDRSSRKFDDVKPMMETLHASVGLFQNNPDLVPGTKQFDRELADKFAELAKSYELRVDGAFVGYTIPVQPMITQLRAQLAAARAAAPPTQPPAPSPQQQRAAGQARTPQGQWTNPEAPQAGIQSRAGNSAAEAEDFSTLFGTIGLPELRI